MHHVRQELSLADLSRAVKLFSRNVHDESLPTSIQTMSCKLLLNLVECIKSRSEQENANGRNLLMQMMEVFVLKFKTVAKLQLPVLMARHRQVPHPSSGGQAGGGGGGYEVGGIKTEDGTIKQEVKQESGLNRSINREGDEGKRVTKCGFPGLAINPIFFCFLFVKY